MTLRSLPTIVMCAMLLAASSPVSAATLATGDLIKTASQPDVYYYGANNKRFVFPNSKTYFTWYANFSNIKTISDAELAAISVGGAATYRPGTRLVKLQTDPHVYAVGQGGILRWLETEQVAKDLYGTDWNTKIDDLPESLMATYKFGTSVKVAADFSPAQESSKSPDISTDRLMLPAPVPAPPVSPTSTPPTAPTSTLSLSLSQASLHAGDVVTISALASDLSGITKIDLFFNNVLIQSCNNKICSGETQVPISGTKPAYETRAVAYATNATIQTKTITTQIETGASNLVTLRLGRPMIRSGQAAEAVVESDVSQAVIRTDIYVDNQSIRACASAIRQCRWSDILTGTIGKIFDVYGRVTDSLGRTYETVHKNLAIGASDAPQVTVAVGKSMINVGEMVDASVSASDDDGISSIEILLNGTILKTCIGSAPCSMNTGPWNSKTALNFSGRAFDTTNTSSTCDSLSVLVQ